MARYRGCGGRAAMGNILSRDVSTPPGMAIFDFYFAPKLLPQFGHKFSLANGAAAVPCRSSSMKHTVPSRVTE